MATEPKTTATAEERAAKRRAKRAQYKELPGAPKRHRNPASAYTAQEREQHISDLVEWLSLGKTLREFCRQENRPSFKLIYDWLDADPLAATRIARAREIGYDAIAEEAQAIADTPLTGVEETITPDGVTIKRADMLGHRKLQIETRLKLLAKWNPKKYGDRQVLAGDADNPIKAEVSFDVFGEILKALQLQRQTGKE